MSWQERIAPGVYVTPSGIRLSFKFENVGKTWDKKTSAFDFPDAVGTFVQDNGATGQRYPLRLFFDGSDCDLAATDFEAGLAEKGVGSLEHPIYGKRDVVPFGRVARRDDLKTAYNQVIIDVTFWESVNIQFPTIQDNPASEVLAAVDAYNVAMPEQFDEVIDANTALEEETFQNQYEAVLADFRTGLQPIANTQADVQKLFNAVGDSIDAGINTLVRDPLTLAAQTVVLIQTPARTTESVQARLDAYQNLLNSIITGDNAIRVPGNDSQASNAFQNDDLFVSTAITGMVVSVVNNDFKTKPQALEAATTILGITASVIAWRDDNYLSLSEIDTGESYQKLQAAVAIVVGFLVEISFTLKQERSRVLTSPRSMIDLAAELYGAIDDDTLNFFIDSNNLTGSEILEIPAGREIVSYV